MIFLPEAPNVLFEHYQRGQGHDDGQGIAPINWVCLDAWWTSSLSWNR